MPPGEGPASNGNAQANGSTSQSAQRTAVSSVTNGARHVNGSANRQLHGESPLYHGHNREEVTRILMQALSDMGYQSAAEQVSEESGFMLESPIVVAFRQSILNGLWPEAEQLLLDATMEPSRSDKEGLVLAFGADRTLMQLWIRQQKYLELLEKGESSSALMVLRNEITPNCADQSTVRFLSGLVMWRSAVDLKAAAGWDGADGDSRRRLLSELSKHISPSVLLPENRLATMLQQVKASQVHTCLYHTAPLSPSLYSDHHCERADFPSDVALSLSDLQDETGKCEAWVLAFSHDGRKLAAAGSPGFAVIWDTHDFRRLKTLDGHEDSISNISWSPDDSMIVTCSMDKHARLWSVQSGELIKKSRRFGEPVSGCVWSSNNQSYTLGSLDKDHSICTFNVRNDEVQEWDKKHRVQDICGSADGRFLVVVNDVQTTFVYNAQTRKLEYEMDFSSRPTSVSISNDSKHLIVNKRDGEAHMLDLVQKSLVRKFMGHTGGDHLIRCAFGGANESFVISGSEDGNVVIWHKHTGAVVEKLRGHVPRANAAVWNPAEPCMLASCGDDGHVRIWTNKTKAKELTARHPGSTNGWAAVVSAEF